MFGFGKMTHDAVVTVVSCSDANNAFVVKSGGMTRCEYAMVVDVSPSGAPPFRTEITHWFARFYSPRAGDQIRARCNPEKGKVHLEVDNDPRYNVALNQTVQHNEQEAQRQADLAAPPGTPPAGTGHRPTPQPGAGGANGMRFDPRTGERQF